MGAVYLKLRKHLGDVIFIGAATAGAVACWAYSLPAWMLVVCLLALFFAVISLLGDLGLFGGGGPD
ncbi:MAG: hypothetical protein OER80_11035 [Gammaproteobacteria bacterium]|nr:hypothetical protein [Gammaproteobacteria bacterium]MDH3767091.1 hypothetical protein [Gammaproteobacteria bacterium]